MILEGQFITNKDLILLDIFLQNILLKIERRINLIHLNLIIYEGYKKIYTTSKQ